MRKLLGLMAGLSLLLTPAAGASATPPTINSEEPGAKALARRPALIVYSGDGAAFLAGLGASAGYPAHLHWTMWSRTQAQAWGGDWHNNCLPSCVQGIFTAYRANVHLDRPEVLGGHLVFTRMTVTYPDAVPPYPAYKSGTWTVRAHYDAQYDSYFWQ